MGAETSRVCLWVFGLAGGLQARAGGRERGRGAVDGGSGSSGEWNVAGWGWKRGFCLSCLVAASEGEELHFQSAA